MFLPIGDSTTFSHHVIKLLSHDFVVNVVINWKLIMDKQMQFNQMKLVTTKKTSSYIATLSITIGAMYLQQLILQSANKVSKLISGNMLINGINTSHY